MNDPYVMPEWTDDAELVEDAQFDHPAIADQV